MVTMVPPASEPCVGLIDATVSPCSKVTDVAGGASPEAALQDFIETVCVFRQALQPELPCE